MEKSRREFIAAAVGGEESIAQLCREFGISRPTAYKWLARYKVGDSLSDRSHEPFSKPHKTPPWLEELILSARARHPTWGPRKLRRSLLDSGHSSLPAVSTVANILKRNGCISPEESEAHTPYIRFEHPAPNDLWQMDFKGYFGMLNSVRCHPLTILDDCSRFSLCVDAKPNETWSGVEPSLLRVFAEYGLPNTILSDNGPPWRDNQMGYTQFELWMMQIGVLPIHGRPYHPQTQGKDERFHKTLKYDLLKVTPIRNLSHAQAEFDAFRYCYNFERPHDALQLDTPAKRYRASSVPLPARAAEPEYCSGRQLRKFNCKGYISIMRHRYYLSETFIGKYLELVDEPDDRVSLCYGDFIIAMIDLNERLIVSRKIRRR